MSNSKKKPVEFYFVDMNDPGRYKKLKVLKACDFCRQRKSKCDIGVPGSGICSNCRKANICCVFSSNKDSPEENRCFDNHNNRSSDNSLDLSVEQQEREQQQQDQQTSSHFIQPHMCLEHARNIPKKPSQSTALMHSIYNQFPAFEFGCMDTTDRPQADSTIIKSTNHSYKNKFSSPLPPSSSSSVLLFLFSLSENAQLASLLYQAYSQYIHPYFPLLYDQPSELSVYSALLAILCYIRPPELLLCNNNNMLLSPTDSEAYMHQADALCLDKWSLGAAQTLLLLHKYQEITSTTLPWTDYYLERACTIFDSFSALSNCHYQQQEVYSIQWLLYVSMGLLSKQQQQNIVYKQWMEKCHNDDHYSPHYQQQISNLSRFPSSHNAYSNYLNSNDNVIMTNFKELVKLLKFYYTHVTKESASVPPYSSCNSNKQFQQAVVDWKLKLPRHLYNNDTTATADAKSRDDSRKSMMEYNTYYSTCLLFLSDTLLLLSLHSFNHGSRSCAENQPLSLSESLATIARLQQCAHTLISTGHFMILGQSTILLALKLALNELICTYTNWFAFNQQQKKQGENSIVHWFGDWCSQSIWICEHLNMDDTFFLAHLSEFRDALIEGDILTRYYHQHHDSYSFQEQNQQKQKQQGKKHYYDNQHQVDSYHFCSSYEPLSSPFLTPTSSATISTATFCNSYNNNSRSFSSMQSYHDSGGTEDGGSSYDEFPTTPTINGDKSQASDYFPDTTSTWVHTTSLGLSLDEHNYQQVIIYYPVLDNNDNHYDCIPANIYE
ncbi:hypothetical protein BDC45DRAFT_530895 [Circinella umbellata]|nr:hypothetical protein BDC45DRAFT_530895 [Circinella umbellata]